MDIEDVVDVLNIMILWWLRDRFRRPASSYPSGGGKSGNQERVVEEKVEDMERVCDSGRRM